MSFDLGVWYPVVRISNEDATTLYDRLCKGDTSGVVPHPATDAFYAELTRKHPEIDSIPVEHINDHDYCPWSCTLDHSPSHVIMSCVWSKATYVHQLVKGLAHKHGLALYDPQSEDLIYPDGSVIRKAAASRLSFWILGVFALLFAGTFVYTGQLSSSGVSVFFYVFAGLAVLWEWLALGKHGKSRLESGNPNLDLGRRLTIKMLITLKSQLPALKSAELRNRFSPLMQ